MSDYLQPELVNEILKRLPVKSLLSFRCVCKLWCSIISSPYFIAQHLSHYSSAHSRTLVRYYSKTHSKEMYTVYDDESFNPENSMSISFPFHEKLKYYYHIAGYCNGLLCLTDDLFRYRETITFVLWNPSINRAVNVRPPRVIFDRTNKSCIFSLGFGFDSENNDYKIVRLAYFLIGNEGRHALPPFVEVFSLSTRIWRRVNNNVESYISDHCWSQAYIHGAVHWVAFKMIMNGQDNRHHRNSVLKFGFSIEEVVELGLPEDLAFLSPIDILATKVRGRLSILHNNNASQSCAIWVMKEYDNVESWSLVFRINLELGLNRVLFVTKGGIVFSGGSGELFFHDFQARKVTSTGIRATRCSLFFDKYVESLVLLGDGKGVWGMEPELDYIDEYERVKWAEESRFLYKKQCIFSRYLKP